MRDRNDCTAAQAAQIKKIEERYRKTVDRWTGWRGYDGPDQMVWLVDFERDARGKRLSADIKSWRDGDFDAELCTWI